MYRNIVPLDVLHGVVEIMIIYPEPEVKMPHPASPRVRWTVGFEEKKTVVSAGRFQLYHLVPAAGNVHGEHFRVELYRPL